MWLSGLRERGDEGGQGVTVGVLFGVIRKELVESLKMQNIEVLKR